MTCFYDNLDVSDPTDPEVTIQIDVANAFNSTNRGLTLDVLNGRASRDYRETMLVASRQGMLFLLVTLYLTFSATLRPCGRVRRD